MLYVVNTNDTCSALGDGFCEDMTGKVITTDYVRRPEPYRVVLLIPGLIFDAVFIFFFRKPIQMGKINMQLQVTPLDKTFVPKKGGGIGGVGTHNKKGLNNLEPIPGVDPQPKNYITGINRPISPGSRPGSGRSSGRNSSRGSARRKAWKTGHAEDDSQNLE